MNEYIYEDTCMGCLMTISLIAPSKEHADAVYARMHAIAFADEKRFSRFNAESELSILNKAGKLQVSPEFMAVFLLAAHMHEKTGGAYNPLVDISRYGYDADLSVVQRTSRLAKDQAPYNTDMSAISLDVEKLHITLAQGQQLDFGGILKGYTAHTMAHEAVGCEGVIVNMGGDLYTFGTDVSGNPFTLTLDNPLNPSLDVHFSVMDSAVATSGTYNRRWMLGGKRMSHILNEQGTDNPDSSIISATVIAKHGYEADAFAKVAIVKGEEQGMELLTQAGVPYAFIRTNGSVTCSTSFPIVNAKHAYA